MSRDNVTTTKNGFRVEDLTFKGARRQSEVAKEIEAERRANNPDADTEDTTVPVSLTPEAVKTFYTSKANATVDMREKRIYLQTLKWIDEMLDLRKKYVALQLKQVNEDTSSDL